MLIERLIEDIRSLYGDSDNPVLSVYADVDPAKPENARNAWVTRVKNAIRDLPEIRDREGKRDTPLYDAVMALLDEERPAARTLALFAARGRQGRLEVRRVDLQVELPVVDLAHGRVESHWGEPYLTPLLYAADEYPRVGILLLAGARWRFYHAFLDEVEEDTTAFAEISAPDWKTLQEAAQRIENVSEARLKAGGKFDKLSPKDRAAAKVSTWLHKLYTRLARLVQRAAADTERLVLVGMPWQVSHFEGYLDRGLRTRVTARLPLPAEAAQTTPRGLFDFVLPSLQQAERAAESALLDRIAAQPGIWGFDPVLDALQMGRVEVLVLPWSVEGTLWHCPDDDFFAGSRQTAQSVCAQPVEVPLRKHVWQLARDYGARVEFVRGEPEQRLLREFRGMAALLRW
ncbi:MAG: VLRF1 family aeRF1-type release factor [Pseudomonadota bacterium]